MFQLTAEEASTMRMPKYNEEAFFGNRPAP